MRIARLDLLRYGRFTDRSIALPRAKRDLHILFGPNEAGKTTSLAAIEDLLFGIPNQTPYGFLHNYDAIRLGAMLEDDDGEFMFSAAQGQQEHRAWQRRIAASRRRGAACAVSARRRPDVFRPHVQPEPQPARRRRQGDSPGRGRSGPDAVRGRHRPRGFAPTPGPAGGGSRWTVGAP